VTALPFRAGLVFGGDEVGFVEERGAGGGVGADWLELVASPVLVEPAVLGPVEDGGAVDPVAFGGLACGVGGHGSPPGMTKPRERGACGVGLCAHVDRFSIYGVGRESSTRWTCCLALACFGFLDVASLSFLARLVLFADAADQRGVVAVAFGCAVRVGALPAVRVVCAVRLAGCLRVDADEEQTARHGRHSSRYSG